MQFNTVKIQYEIYAALEISKITSAYFHLFRAFTVLRQYSV
jgi:hypothetical protein